MPNRTWLHFTYWEFRCKKLLKNGKHETCKHCNGSNETKMELVSLLDFVRSIVGFPIIVESGFRCDKRNKEAGGGEDSEHKKGAGADVRCNTSQDRYMLVKTALSVGFNRIGIGKNFIHLGISKTRPQNVIWRYD